MLSAIWKEGEGVIYAKTDPSMSGGVPLAMACGCERKVQERNLDHAANDASPTSEGTIYRRADKMWVRYSEAQRESGPLRIALNEWGV